MKIVMINQFFPPALAPTGRLLADLAAEGIRRGHEITVLASAAGYGAETGEGEIPPDGVEVIRVGSEGLHQSGVGSKFREYLRFRHAAGRKLSGLSPRPDVLVCMTTPPFIGGLAVRLRKREGIPYVLWCMDLYPEALAAHQGRPVGPLFYRLFRRAAVRERSGAAGVVSLGPDMSRLLEQSGARRIEEIPVWAEDFLSPATEAEARRLRRDRGWGDDEIIFQYSGNMGRAHRIREFSELARRLREQTVRRCRMVFSGTGPNRKRWKREAGNLFEWLPPVSQAGCAAHLLAADVHLVSQDPDWCGVVVPSKFQAACAAGRPVLFAGPEHSAVGTWISRSGSGWLLPSGNSDAVESALGEVLQDSERRRRGQAARRLYEERFTRRKGCAGLMDLVEYAAGKRT